MVTRKWRIRDDLTLVAVALILALAWVGCRVSRRFREGWGGLV